MSDMLKLAIKVGLYSVCSVWFKAQQWETKITRVNQVLKVVKQRLGKAKSECWPYLGWDAVAWVKECWQITPSQTYRAEPTLPKGNCFGLIRSGRKCLSEIVAAVLQATKFRLWLNLSLLYAEWCHNNYKCFHTSGLIRLRRMTFP